MKLVGSRVVAVLLIWLAVGFMADAALAPLQAEALEQTGAQSVPEATRTGQLVVASIGVTVLVVGLVILVRDPGAPEVEEDARTGAPAVESGPNRCWRCRERWPPGAKRCPSCGAKRLR